ncbi:hadley isoform 1-T10 [Glossina fuscipes fuscipes]
MKELTWSAAVGDFRTKGKCFALHGSFFIVLLLSIGHGSCRPEQSDDDFKLRMIRENTTTTTAATKIKLNTIANGGEHDNADKDKLFILNHPEITYKEDYVNEDYKDPVKHSVKSDIPITAESYKRLKPEKMYFDVLPKKPVIVIENLPKKSKASRLKVNPLSEDVTDKQSNKLSHNERDEIVHLRKKRSTQTITDNQQNVLQALNPYFRNVLVPCSNCGGANGIRAQYILVNRPVPGKKHNALDIPVRPPPPPTDMPIGFDSRIAADENDRVIFSGGSRTTQRPVATRRPPESIFRDPNPGNFDFSFMNPGNQNTQSMRPMGPAGNAPRTTTMRPPALPSVAPPPAQGNRGISQCVWAIVNCCSTGDSEIRYSCFEQNGCYGAFWDLNPCAESVRDNIITYVADYYD